MKIIEKQKNYSTYSLVQVGQCFFPCKISESLGYLEGRDIPMMKIGLDDLSVELKTGNVTKVEDDVMCLIANYSLVEE